MEARMLLVDTSKCTGCRTCEVACSHRHEGKAWPALSRTHVVKFEALGINVPTVCAQCGKPKCLAACPVGAISLDRSSGVVAVDEEACLGCRACVSACSFSQMGFHPEKRVAFKCDLCGGEPTCARFCPTGALQYRSTEDFLAARRRALCERTLDHGEAAPSPEGR